ncbi:MAG: DUF1841 family protein [Sutterellaceae bacterium]|nr:DUF1841 family protein [Burkholderiaceae bacterium]MCX7900772.1 DUF1841 family protein [Burkholderiaceae bacterium]MDW8429148.1 DUF1841 family protein [Sutterellaceae bacterium]
MFNPSRDDVRRFFCAIWRKRRAGEVLQPIEAAALEWIERHPEYQPLLEDEAAALAAEFPPEEGRENPFLHLAMHLALSEQAAIDQPPGIRALLQRLRERCGDEHAAAHEAMECLGRIVWEAQRALLPPDPAAINAAYLDCLARRATRR